MIPCALIALRVAYGGAVGLLGAGGQIILFQALRTAPAYLLFPIVSLYPVLTVALSVTLLKERASRRAWAGIVTALVALPLLALGAHGLVGEPRLSYWSRLPSS